MKIKNNLKFVMIFSLVILLFLWKIIAMKNAFITGDHLTQFYPWFKIYSESIKHLSFPFWTRYMQSGFPLMAEGQIGGFYLLNIVFFLIMPFNIAYNYIVIFHFIIAGISIYLLVRKLGACEFGGIIAAIVFCFGSAYAGGFYNIITLKTLSWTPLVLFLFELFFEKRRPLFIITAGIIFGMQLLAGFIQMAVYCWVFYAVYFLYKSRISKQALYLLLFSFTAFLLFIPQLLLTYKLAALSSRTTANLQFALWGSYNPIYLAQAVFPYWPRFLRNDLYVSVFGILFLISSFYLLKTDRKIRAVFIIFVLSFLMALGRYNPFYVLVVKLCHLYSFRNPSKFLFFTTMTASVLIGTGFSAFIKDDFRYRDSVLRLYCIILCFCGLIFLASKTIFIVFKNVLIEMGEKYASKFIFATSAHRYDLNVYIKKVDNIYQSAVNGVSFNNIFNIASWLLLIAAFIASLLIMKRRNLRMPVYSKYLIIFIVVLDLFIYGFIGKGLRSDMRSYDMLKPDNAAIYNYIKSDKNIFRVLPYGVGSGKLPLWIMPNTNILYDIDSVAGYTPLANESYRKAILTLEVVDNSLGVRLPEKDSIKNNLDLLRLLNVKYIVSYDKLDSLGIEFILEDNGIFLYRVNNYLPRAFIVKGPDLKSVDSNVEVKVIKYDSGRADFNVHMRYKGLLVFSENNYAGWKAYVNGKARKLVPFSVVSAVELNEGEDSVSLVYNPY